MAAAERVVKKNNKKKKPSISFHHVHVDISDGHDPTAWANLRQTWPTGSAPVEERGGGGVRVQDGQESMGELTSLRRF